MRERERERRKERTVEILSERERKQAYVLTHAHTPPHTYTRKHTHTDAYMHARIMIPDTHTHTYMRRHAQLRAVKGGLADLGWVGSELIWRVVDLVRWAGESTN